MKISFVTERCSSRLILIYAGWAMDYRPFVGLRRQGYDIAVVWDYTDRYVDWSEVSDYQEICVIAWSFGVYMAATTSHAIDRLTTLRIAVCGTLYPVDRRRGIPPQIYSGTLDGLDERSLTKFYRRMAGSRQVYESFAAALPHRDIGDLRDELEYFGGLHLFGSEPLTRWDRAIIGREDAIIPPVNQWRAWTGTPVTMLECGHMPDFQVIIDRYVMDKERVGDRFGHGRGSYDAYSPVQARVVEDIIRLGCRTGVLPSPEGARVLEIGCGTGRLTRALHALLPQRHTLQLWDIAGDSPVADIPHRFERTDAESRLLRTPSGAFDLIATASTVQWFNSLSRFMVSASRVLTPGGALIFSTFVHGNLWQVSQATGRSLPLPTFDEILESIPADMELLDARHTVDTLEFDTPLDVFRHLKSTGVNSLGRTSAGESSLSGAIAH